MFKGSYLVPEFSRWEPRPVSCRSSVRSSPSSRGCWWSCPAPPGPPAATGGPGRPENCSFNGHTVYCIRIRMIETRDIRSNITLCMKEVPRAKPKGTPEGKGIYLTVYTPLSHECTIQSHENMQSLNAYATVRYLVQSIVSSQYSSQMQERSI